MLSLAYPLELPLSFSLSRNLSNPLSHCFHLLLKVLPSATVNSHTNIPKTSPWFPLVVLFVCHIIDASMLSIRWRGTIWSGKETIWNWMHWAEPQVEPCSRKQALESGVVGVKASYSPTWCQRSRKNTCSVSLSHIEQMCMCTTSYLQHWYLICRYCLRTVSSSFTTLRTVIMNDFPEVTNYNILSHLLNLLYQIYKIFVAAAETCSSEGRMRQI